MQEPLPEAHRLVGAVLAGRYRLEQLLGEGGVGAVFRASVSGGGTVAIKVLHPEFRDNPEIVRRFFDEATIAARLNHPGVVQVYESGQAEDGTPYLAMELLVGRPLDGALEISGPLPLAFATTLLQTALGALHFAHQHGVVHRDLKPENLFVMTPPDGPPTLKIVDFGIAKVMDAAGGMGTRTRTGMLMGTPAYMSPEQLRDSKSVDPRSDLWSMTVIIYQMLTGHEPFPAENPMQQIHLVLGTDAPPIASHVPALAPLQPFIDRGLARNPAERFPSALAMSEALVAFQRAIDAGQPPPPLSLASVPPPGSHSVAPDAYAPTVAPNSGMLPPPGQHPDFLASHPAESSSLSNQLIAPGQGWAPAHHPSAPPPAPQPPGSVFPAAAPPPGPSLTPSYDRITSPGTSGRSIAVIVLVVAALLLLIVAAVALVIAMR